MLLWSQAKNESIRHSGENGKIPKDFHHFTRNDGTWRTSPKSVIIRHYSLFGFADGFAPFKEILSKKEAANFDIKAEITQTSSQHALSNFRSAETELVLARK